jgi:hypothetical protein
MVKALAVQGLLARVEPGEALLAHHAHGLAHRLAVHRVQGVPSQACTHIGKISHFSGRSCAIALLFKHHPPPPPAHVFDAILDDI